MDIIIHRGSHQIGGCATEYRTDKTRIFIDFGAELDSEKAHMLDIQGVTKGVTNCDAIFFTHYHGDHMGLLDTINKDVPLYMGVASKEIAKIFNKRLSKAQNIKSYDADRIDAIKTFDVAKPVIIGDIKITPYTVDHSAYDAYMFKIEADGKTVLHTGDFRTHGFRGKGVKVTLEKYVGKVDALLCEGTTLGRTETRCETENDLKNRIKTVLEENKYVFVVCSSTNIDRLAGICSVVPKGKCCICDKYQLSVIEYIRDYAGNKSSLYKFGKALYYKENLDEKMEKEGFCMFVRCGNPAHKRIMDMYKDKNSVVIYSMWKGYLKQDNIKDFLNGYKRFDMHTSGHADSDAIKMVIDTVKPDIIVPMHTETPEKFLKITGRKKVLIAEDNEVIKLEKKVIEYNTYYKNDDMNNTNFDEILNEIEANINSFKDSSNYKIVYRDSYVVKSHNISQKDIQKGYASAKKAPRFRKEEWICKLALGKSFDEVGKIVDFQVPLKVPGAKEEENTGRGKIDLLSYNEETNTAYLLEVKVDTSTESPLRAIMECYTYWQQIGGNNSDEFLLKTVIGKKATLKKAIVLFESNEKRFLYRKLEKNKDRLKKLMTELGIECFIAETSSDANIIDNLKKYV